VQSWIQLAGLVAAISVIAVTTATAAGEAVGDPTVREGLARLGGRTIFFGHQSVGMNVLDGLQVLATREGADVRIAELKPGVPVRPGTIAHAWVGENQRPLTKIDEFARALDAIPAPDIDVALVKLCYVDFTPDTDAAAIMARYQAAIADLRRRHPQTTFVHVTAPLSTVQGGAKAMLKRVMGKQPYGLVENVRREEYNALLRQAYRGKEPFFDLARVESTAPDGRVETVEWKGGRVPVLVSAYTEDGGHLNEDGRIRAARELLSVLASIPDGARAGAASTK
jgi:lysophospholipase L1-like esterase